MSGALTLAGIDPDHTPLDRWLGALWAVIVQFAGPGAGMEHLDKLWALFDRRGPEHDLPDRDTWGLLPEHLSGQQALLDGLAEA